jgi:hypothetical protein
MRRVADTKGVKRPSHRRLVTLVLGTALIAGAACAPPAPGTPGGGNPGASVSGVKPPIVGFLPRGTVIRDEWAGTLRGVTMNLTWAELEPTQGAPLPATTPVDDLLKRVRAYNASHPGATLGIKLRVGAGVEAPDWLKNQVGATLVHNPSGPESGVVPFWWKPEVDQAYRALQARLAARYDGVPEIREVQISRCTMIFAEPFLRMRTDSSYQVFRANGLTRAADEACLRQQNEAHAVWKHTRSNLALNPYQDVEFNDGHPDVAFTLAIADHCRQVLGERCSLDNHSIRDYVQDETYEQVYEGIRVRGGHNVVQTANAGRIGDWGKAFDRARWYGFDSIELPNDFEDAMSAETFRARYGTTLAYFDQVRAQLGV